MQEIRKRRKQIELPRTTEVNSTVQETMDRLDMAGEEGMEERGPGSLGIKDPKQHQRVVGARAGVSA